MPRIQQPHLRTTAGVKQSGCGAINKFECQEVSTISAGATTLNTAEVKRKIHCFCSGDVVQQAYKPGREVTLHLLIQVSRLSFCSHDKRSDHHVDNALEQRPGWFERKVRLHSRALVTH